MKGQISVEYLIILVVMVLLFSSVSLDLTEYSLNQTLNVQTGEMLRSSNITMTNVINTMNIQGPGAKKLVSLRAPADCNFSVGPSEIVTWCRIQSPSEVWNGTIFGDGPPSLAYNCLTCNGSIIESGNIETIQIVKS